MGISKQKRELVKNKFNGKCGYTGTELNEDWEVDHIFPKWMFQFFPDTIASINDIDNLIPTQKIINHYKRSYDLEGFRKYMNSFHIRLNKLPKNPRTKKSIKHKKYMIEISNLFNITTENPFCGKFYFEKFNIY